MYIYVFICHIYILAFIRIHAIVSIPLNTRTWCKYVAIVSWSNSSLQKLKLNLWNIYKCISLRLQYLFWHTECKNTTITILFKSANYCHIVPCVPSLFWYRTMCFHTSTAWARVMVSGNSLLKSLICGRPFPSRNASSVSTSLYRRLMFYAKTISKLQ